MRARQPVEQHRECGAVGGFEPTAVDDPAAAGIAREKREPRLVRHDRIVEIEPAAQREALGPCLDQLDHADGFATGVSPFSRRSITASSPLPSISAPKSSRKLFT